MNLSNIAPVKGSVKKVKRIGRGQGSNRGGTSTKGNKGAQSRSGYSRKNNFEGGQMPLARRLPKFGFKNINECKFSTITVETLCKHAEKFNINNFNIETIAKFVKKSKSSNKIKVIGNTLKTNKISVEAHAFSEGAKKNIETNGGTAIIIK